MSIISFIFFNFLRTRLPREIPFELTEFRFYILIGICTIYLYAIKQLCYPKPPNVILINFIKILYKPLHYFYKYLFNINKINQKHKSFIIFLIKDLNIWNTSDFALLFYFLNIIPRAILLSIFILDVFWLHYISIFYYFIFLSAFPLFYYLFIFYMNYSLERFILSLEQNYTKVMLTDTASDELGWEPNSEAIYHDEFISIRVYIDVKHKLYIENSDIEYRGDACPTDECYEEYKIKNNKSTLNMEDYNILGEDFQLIMPQILIIKLSIEQVINAPKYFYIQHIKLVIALLYLICWLYILIVSFHTLNDISYTLTLLEILTKYSNIDNPF